VFRDRRKNQVRLPRQKLADTNQKYHLLLDNPKMKYHCYATTRRLSIGLIIVVLGRSIV